MPITDLLGGLPKNLDEAFATFLPLPGGTLISQSVPMYPFANVFVAANATIQEPISVSLVMIAPVNQRGGYSAKLSTFSAFQASITKHNALAGVYVVATPALVYDDVLMTAMTDITSEDFQQKQIEWQIDFIKPLVSQASAISAYGSLMGRLQSGVKTAPSYSGGPAASPANQQGVTGALANITQAWSAFGAQP